MICKEMSVAVSEKTFFKKVFIYLFFRDQRREEERERNVDVNEKH